MLLDSVIVLDKKSRLHLLMAVRNKLAGPSLSWADVNLILETYDLGSYDPDDTWSPTLQDVLRTATDQQLVEIADFLELDAPTLPVPVSHVPTVRSARPLFVFGSHLATHRVLVGQVKAQLGLFGIELFVAHDSIEEGELWQRQIEEALGRADAGLTFLHDGFRNSAWCDQEIGWLQGRKVPIITLSFDLDPYGFLGKQQALKIRGNLAASDIAGMVLERLSTRPEISLGFGASLISAITDSHSFAHTNSIWHHLRDLTCLDADLCSQLLTATKSNNQIFWAYSKLHGDGRQAFTRLIVDFLRRQPGGDVVASDIDAYENYLDEQDAEWERQQEEVRTRLQTEQMAATDPSDPFA